MQAVLRTECLPKLNRSIQQRTPVSGNIKREQRRRQAEMMWIWSYVCDILPLKIQNGKLGFLGGNMRKELKYILIILTFAIIGGVIGCFMAGEQMDMLSDPEYIALFESRNMPVPEPVGLARAIASFTWLFAGMPTGLIFYAIVAQKWLTPIAPKIIIGFIAFPIYTIAGVVGSIPFVVYNVISLLSNKSDA